MSRLVAGLLLCLCLGASAAEAGGDATAGAVVFRKCATCHTASEPVNQQLVDQPPVDRRAAGDYRCLRIRYVSVAASMRRRLREPGPIARRARPYR